MTQPDKRARRAKRKLRVILHGRKRANRPDAQQIDTGAPVVPFTQSIDGVGGIPSAEAFGFNDPTERG